MIIYICICSENAHATPPHLDAGSRLSLGAPGAPHSQELEKQMQRFRSPLKPFERPLRTELPKVEPASRLKRFVAFLCKSFLEIVSDSVSNWFQRKLLIPGGARYVFEIVTVDVSADPPFQCKAFEN